MLPQNAAAAGDREVPAAATTAVVVAGDVRKDSPAAPEQLKVFTPTGKYKDNRTYHICEFQVNFPNKGSHPSQLVVYPDVKQNTDGIHLILPRLHRWHVLNISAPVTSLPKFQQHMFRAAVCTSRVLFLGPTSVLPASNYPILIGFIKFDDSHENFIIDCYMISLDGFKTYATAFLKEIKQPPVFVVIDLDLTMFMSINNCPKNQRHLFVTDVETEGILSVNDDPYREIVQLRAGAHTFLHRLIQMGAVILVKTASDLNRARDVVAAANKCQWATSSPDESLPPTGPLPEVHIPLDRVFSVQYKPKRTIFKTFEGWRQFFEGRDSDDPMPPLMLAVDDDPTMWDEKSVIPIKPFELRDNSPSHLLRTADLIEQITADYYTQPAPPSDLSKPAPQSNRTEFDSDQGVRANQRFSECDE
jgi:hypothetical protein